MQNFKIPVFKIIEFENNEESIYDIISDILKGNISTSYSHSYERKLDNRKFNKVLENYYNTNPRICIRTIEYCEKVCPQIYEDRIIYKLLSTLKTLHIFNKDGSEDMIRI